MSKKKRQTVLLIFLCSAIVCLIGSIAAGHGPGHSETVKEMMKDAVLHEENRMLLFGIRVNPALISAMTITGCLLFLALMIRIFVIPRFQFIPGKIQLILEELVAMADKLARKNSPHRNHFLGAYLFAAGGYIFIGTCFELFGIQAVCDSGISMALPAPLSDINAAIAMGIFSYGVIMSGGIAGNGFRGIALTLKDFSLPISMSFRLFGALLSGLLVTELVYYYFMLSFLLPVVVGVLFTLLHAIVQTYVLTMLTSMFYGEVSEHKEKKTKRTPVEKKRNRMDKTSVCSR